MKYFFLEETVSTNDYIKQFLSGGEDVVVCAARQTGGKGTKGRSFCSEEGGVYLSALTFSRLPAGRAFEIMAHAAVAVAKTAERFGLSPEIKWCNDVLAGGRKLAGILIENVLSDGFVKASVAGIGLNVSNDLAGLETIAINMKELLPRCPSAEEVRRTLIENYFSPTTFDEYLSRAKFLGREVRVTEGERVYFARACEILTDGRLLVEEKGVRRALSAAEIAIKL